MIIRMRLRAGAAIPGRLSTHPLCPRSPGTGPSEQSTTQPQRRTRLPPAAPTTKSPAQDGISIESHPRSSTEPQLEPPVPVLRTDVREAQEIERVRLPVAAALPILGGEPPEFDQPRLLGRSRLNCASLSRSSARTARRRHVLKALTRRVAGGSLTLRRSQNPA